MACTKRVPKVLALLVLLPTAAMTGQCGQVRFGSDGLPCTAQAVPSVILHIVDADDDPVATATTTFRIDGGAAYIGTCTGDCGAVILAYEAVGTFSIEVGAPGYRTVQTSVVVELDEVGCHPVTEERDVVMERDQTVAALAGAWTTTNFYGATTLRFGSAGQIIGAILYDRTIAGDHNFYVAYNGHAIQGASGQQIFTDQATDPARSGSVFNFRDTTLGFPVGFENATISDDYNTLTGTLQGVSATYARLADIPTPLQDP